MNDPFEQFDNDNTPKEESKPITVKTEAVGTGEGKIVLTFKEGAGFDASWVVVHAADVADATTILSDPAFAALLDRTKVVAKHFRGGEVSAGGGAARGGGNSGGGGDIPAKHLADKPGDGWQYKTGAKNGKPWAAWMPPQGSDDSIKPVWLKP